MYVQSASALAKATNSNIELAERVRQLEEANAFTEEINTSERVIAKKAEMMKERRRCETLKGVVQGIIVGSGVNWAEDEGLRKLVMLCGEE